jgi:hypothetical protein
MAPMIAAFAAAYMGQIFVWRRWDRYEQHRLFERERSSGFTVGLLILCAGVCLSVPLSFAIAHRFDGVVWQWVLASAP